MTTAEFEKPARASPGVSTLVTSSRASELSATMSDLTLSAIKATMVRANTAITMATWPEGEANHVPTVCKVSMDIRLLGVKVMY